jgi:hypothetical protein
MAKKEFEIKGKFDTSEFDRSIEQMQRKLKDLYQAPDLIRSQNANSARMNQAGMGNFNPMNPGNSVQQRREADQQAIRNNQTAEALIRTATQRERIENKISQNLKENVSLSKEQYELEVKKRENSQAQSEEYRRQAGELQKLVGVRLNQRDQEERNLINTAMGERNYIQANKAAHGLDFDESSGGGGPRPPGSKFNTWAKGSGAEMGSNMAGLAKSVGIALAVATTANMLLSHYASMPIQTEASMGSAVQNTSGKQLESLSQGDAIGTTAYDQKRQEAMKMAKDKFYANYRRPTNLSQYISAAGMGLTENKLGLFQGAHQKFSDSYDSSKQAEYGEDYQKVLEAKKAQDPLLNAATSRFQGNNQRDLGMQRQLGLDYNTYHGAGGYLERANTSGFNERQGIQMSQDIMGAGGSTRMGRDTTGGLQLQGGMNLTNIGSILGKISGQTGNSGMAQQLTERMLEEAVARGFSKSEFTDEFRKFAEMASTIIANSGTKSLTDTDSLTQGLGRFVGDNITPGGLQGAQTAYDAYQGRSSQTSGRGGAINYAELASNKMLGKLDPTGMGGIMEMPEDQVSENSVFLQEQAAELRRKGDKNATTKNVVSEIKGAKRKADMAVGTVTQSDIDAANNWLTKNGKDQDSLSDDDWDSMPAGVLKGMGAVVRKDPKTAAFAGNQAASASIRGTLKGFAKVTPRSGGEPSNSIADSKRDLTPAEQIAVDKAKAAAGATGRPEDANERALGALNQKFLQNFRDYVTVITPAAEALAIFTANMVDFLKKSGAPAPQTGAKAKPDIQSQASKPGIMKQILKAGWDNQ